MSVRRKRREALTGVELELTAFINPMVVLVTFLLVNMVFSHSAVLDLRLPGPGGEPAAAAPATKPLLLEVTVRAQALEIGDRNRGRLAEIPNRDGAPDFARLSSELVALKSQHPDQKEATVLLEADVSYDRLIQVMDAVRAVDQVVDGQRRRSELFPSIAIGDAAVGK